MPVERVGGSEVAAVPSSIFQILSQIQTKLDRLEATTNELLTGPWSLQYAATAPILHKTTCLAQIPSQLEEAWPHIIREIIRLSGGPFRPIIQTWGIGTRISGNGTTFPYAAVTLTTRDAQLWHSAINGHGHTTTRVATKVKNESMSTKATGDTIRKLTAAMESSKYLGEITIMQSIVNIDERLSEYNIDSTMIQYGLPEYTSADYDSRTDYDDAIAHIERVTKLGMAIENNDSGEDFAYSRIDITIGQPPL
ncbi:MAG: hypothetical protein LBJ69_02675 [Holosporales bacterium]|nr:hypothetical protein [Holosporales bacterium]